MNANTRKNQVCSAYRDARTISVILHITYYIFSSQYGAYRDEVLELSLEKNLKKKRLRTVYNLLSLIVLIVSTLNDSLFSNVRKKIRIV